jgi:hypothetical protein
MNFNVYDLFLQGRAETYWRRLRRPTSWASGRVSAWIPGLNAFRHFSREVRDGIEAEVTDLGRFLDAPASWSARPAK